VLADQLRVLGPDHPHTLATRVRLAQWRGQAGDPAAAVLLLDEVLEDQLRVFGSDNPTTWATRATLVHWCEQIDRTAPPRRGWASVTAADARA